MLANYMIETRALPVGILELVQRVSGSFQLAGQALIEGSHHISRQVAVIFCRANPKSLTGTHIVQGKLAGNTGRDTQKTLHK